MKKNQLQPLMEQLGYTFHDLNHLKLALTHRSADTNHYERLEFLGDSLLNFLVAEALFARFSNIAEGTLTRLRSQLVNGHTLAEIGKDLQLNEYIRLGRGEVRSGGRERSALLADVFEAIMGAVYLDGGLEACRTCLHRWYGDRLHTITPDKLEKDPKTNLQEHLQSQKNALPRYVITDVSGPAHEVTFSASCSVPGIAHTTHGQGPTRRRAEQAAAREFLHWLQQTESAHDD